MKRKTRETKVEVSLDPYGSGISHVHTGINLLDEILSALADAASFDLALRGEGDLETGDHHTCEDVGITLGNTLSKLITKGTGSSIVPSGGCLAMAALRFGEPGYYSEFSFKAKEADGLQLENFGHLMRSIAYNGRFTLHLKAEGDDDRRKIDALTTATGRALRKAALESRSLDNSKS